MKAGISGFVLLFLLSALLSSVGTGHDVRGPGENLRFLHDASVDQAAGPETPSASILIRDWMDMQPARTPLARLGSAMAYDAESDRIVLFGGQGAAGASDETWTYGDNTRAWTRRNPVTSPSPRFGHAMAYDMGSDRVILFGGYDGTYLLGDTWAYDLKADTWMELQPANPPPPRREHAMVYDVESDRVVLFGGSGLGYLNDTWAFDFDGNAWTRMNPAVSPTERVGHSMAYDAESDRVVLFGGHNITGGLGFFLNDTWTYDFNANTWMEMSPAAAPPSRRGSTLAYETQSDLAVLFGGYVGDDGDVEMANDTWSYDLNRDSWTLLSPATAPPARWRHAMAYHAGSNRLVVFGGVMGLLPLYDDTWAYEAVADTWTRMEPVLGPAPRWGHALAYDEESQLLVLFGGEEWAGSTISQFNDTWVYDTQTNRWREMRPLTAPAPRAFHAMAYDAESDRVILFGGVQLIELDEGLCSCSNDETWAYDYDANAWTRMNPSLWPSSRGGHAMAYDGESDRVVLFGERPGAPNGVSGETWAYDFNADAWMLMNPSSAPPPQMHHAMAYDAGSDRIVLLGRNETWAYDYDRNLWTNRTPHVAPPGPDRHGHAMAYDAESGRTILFGGWVRSVPTNETWAYEYNENNWTRMALAEAPPARAFVRMAYHAASDRILLFGGQSVIGRVGWVYHDTWSYDFNDDSWTDRAKRPSPRVSPAMVYHSESDRVVLFGGFSGHYLNDTWSYDADHNLWRLLRPGGAPSPRGGHAMAYDSESDRVVLFGGQGRVGDTVGQWLNDTWTYDNNNGTWTRMEPVTSPPPRHGHSMAYDGESDRIILFGGVGVRNGTWSYDLNTDNWTRMDPGTSPSSRFGHAMAYDSGSDQVLLFGGQALGILTNDTWAYDLNTNKWTQLAIPLAPTARAHHAMAYDAESDRTVLFGGYDGSALSNETWTLDLTNETWTWIRPSLAPFPRAVHAMAYDAGLDRVILFGGAGGGDDTWAYLETVGMPPGAPQGLVATARDARVILAWSPPADDGGLPVMNYRIYRGTTPGDVRLLAVIPDVLAYTDRDVTNNVTYYYQVTAVNLIGEGPPTDEVSAIPMPPDSTPPVIAITSPGDGAVLASTSITVAGTVSDNVAVAMVEVSPDGGTTWVLAEGTTSWSITLKLSEGEHTIIVRATDTAGNVQTSVVSVTVDITVPIVQIESPGDGNVLASTTVVVFGTASDNLAVAKVEVSIDVGATWVLATGTTSWSIALEVAEGDHIIQVRAGDTAGNVGTASVSVTVQLSPPEDDQPTPAATPPWVLIGAGTAVAAAGLLALLLLRRRRKG